VVVLLLLQVRDDNIAFVQTCWTFINSDSLLTWAQKVGLDFHFAVEQRARSFLGHFFNFNGTAGACADQVWVISMQTRVSRVADSDPALLFSCRQQRRACTGHP